GTRLRHRRQRLPLQFVSVPIYPADTLSVPGCDDRAETASAAGRGAVAAAQPIACGGGTGFAGRDVRRQADRRRGYRLPGGGIQPLRVDTETIGATVRGMPDGGEAAVDGR